MLFAEVLSKSFPDPVKRCLVSVLAPGGAGAPGEGMGQRNLNLEPARKALGSGEKEGRPETREDGAGTKQTLNHTLLFPLGLGAPPVTSPLTEPPPAVTPGQG